MGGEGVQVGRIPARGRLAVIRTHHSQGPKFSYGPPLGVVEYGGRGGVHVLQAPAQGRPTIEGGLPPPLLQGRISPSPCGRNPHPSLPIIPISLLLCTSPRNEGAGSVAASILSPVPSPVIPSGVICSVCRDPIFLSSLSSLLSLSRSKYQRFVPRTTNCPPQSKNPICLFLCMPHLNKLTKPICHEIHPGVINEVQKGELLHRVLTTTLCH